MASSSISGVGGRVGNWPLLDGGSDRRFFDLSAGYIHYILRFFLTPCAMTPNCVEKTKAVQDCLWKCAGIMRDPGMGFKSRTIYNLYMFQELFR